MAEKILCVVAHPDDETFGPGATLAKHAAAGDPVSVFVLADGVGSRMGPRAGPLALGGLSEAVKERHGMFRRACKILGTEDVWLYQFTDNAMDTVPLLQVVQQVERHVKRFEPTVVYTHWSGDLNQDHRVVHDAVNIACRPAPGCTVRKLLYFEVPCSTAWGMNFSPNYFVNVEATIEKKIEACKEYATELREPPHPRSLAAVVRRSEFRGANVGISCAEAFSIGRIIE